MRRTLLVVTAHPDDESFSMGGTIARYAREGVRVVLACATRGEAGKTGDPPLCTPEELPRVRERELQCAARVLGIERIDLLGFLDKGLDHAGREEVTGKILRIMDEEAPEVVLTMPPGGISGHRDHQVVSLCATRAFFRHREMGGAHKDMEGLDDRPRALYYATFPAHRIKSIRGHIPAHPLDTAVTASIDVREWLDIKIAAITCHRTQGYSIERVFRGFPPGVRRWLGRETYYRLFPPADPETPPQTDVFVIPE